MSCHHPEVYPDGTCTSCGVLATGLPGLCEAHRMVPRGTLSPDDRARLRDLARKAYQKFCHDTMPERHVMDFETELPELVQQAWINVVKLVVVEAGRDLRRAG